MYDTGRSGLARLPWTRTRLSHPPTKFYLVLFKFFFFHFAFLSHLGLIYVGSPLKSPVFQCALCDDESMDGVSSTASATAIASFAIQLADNIKKLYDFWQSVKEAPEDIRAITADLNLLWGVLSNIAFEAQHVGPDATLTTVLQSCNSNVKTLILAPQVIEPGFTSTSLRVRKWSAVKAVWKREKLSNFQAVLERLKTTLLLVQQTRYRSGALLS